MYAGDNNLVHCPCTTPLLYHLTMLSSVCYVCMMINVIARRCIPCTLENIMKLRWHNYSNNKFTRRRKHATIIKTATPSELWRCSISTCSHPVNNTHQSIMSFWLAFHLQDAVPKHLKCGCNYGSCGNLFFTGGHLVQSLLRISHASQYAFLLSRS